MNFYDEVLRAERHRTLGEALDVQESDEYCCPVCGSCGWNFLFRDWRGDLIGCQECVTKEYPGERM